MQTTSVKKDEAPYRTMIPLSDRFWYVTFLLFFNAKGASSMSVSLLTPSGRTGLRRRIAAGQASSSAQPFNWRNPSVRRALGKTIGYPSAFATVVWGLIILTNPAHPNSKIAAKGLLGSLCGIVGAIALMNGTRSRRNAKSVLLFNSKNPS
ncbi:MAG: hypothetical protein VKK59_06070 [Vampirovibrionales bacterium]|nr:hypothetical protein [Vampirovibrionales bacterium]